MARNGNGKRNLPAKISNRGTHPNSRANLKHGNPGPHEGAGRPATAVRLRALTLLNDAKGLEVAAGIIKGEEYEPRVVDKEIIHAAPTNRDKLAAAEFLARIGDAMPRAGVTVNAEGPVTVQVWRFGDREISF